MSTTRARELRKDLTASEKRLWYALRPLRQRGFHFRKQHPVGHFVVDFACLSYRLLVEADGGVHDRPERAAFDAMRDEILRRKGFRVLHFPASAVMRELMVW